MSNYHRHCTEENVKEKKKSTTTKPALTSKPFCDCRYCMCKDCPDILRMLAITVTESSCDFGSKVKETGKDANGATGSADSMRDLLDVLKDRDCACEVVAHAVRSNVHMNIGMSERRGTVNSDQKTPNVPKNC